MKLFSIFRKNQPESTAAGDGFYSRAEEESGTGRSRAKRKGASARREPVDPALPEKKRARRRLVGAVALVLALVIGLPMILDSEPKPLTSDISIQIPSKGKTPAVVAPEPKSAPLPETTAPAPARPASLDAAEEIIEQGPAKPAVAQAEATPATKASQPEAKPAIKDKPAAHAPELALAKPAAKPEPKEKPEAKPAVRSAVADKADDAARAKAILEGKFDMAPAAAKTAEAKHGKFVVQVAALASADKVSELRGKLSEAGISSYTQKVATASGERIRIRVGPFGNKDDAEKMRSKLGKLGLSGTLVPA